MNERFDIAAVRREFPITQRMLYFDSAHQAPLAASVRSALHRFYDEGHENAGPKTKWLGRVEQARSRVARLLHCEPGEVAFTKNTSEGLNIAAQAVPLQPGDNVLLIHGDHPNNAYAWLNLRKRGVEARFIRLESEHADAATFEPFIDERTRVITLSHITFHAGHRHDIASVGRLCDRGGLRLVVDAMQSVGVFPTDVRSLGVSIFSAGCHKGLLTPQGLGVFFCDRSHVDLQPAYIGLASLANPPADLIARQDDLALHGDARRFEYGNYNLADLHALNASLDLILGIGVENIAEHVLDLGDLLISHMDRLGVGIVGPRSREHRSHIYVLSLPVDKWIDYFASRQVRASPERDGVRISFSLFNTAEEVERLATIVAAGLKDLGSPRSQQPATQGELR